MDFLSTYNPQHRATFRKAVLSGIAPCGGLYVPEEIPAVPQLMRLGTTFNEMGAAFTQAFCGDAIPQSALQEIVEKAHNFPLPLVRLTERFGSNPVFVLELFHGPTLAFKDFGARFMSEVMGHFVKESGEQIHVLVATSGDTGGAVASAFHRVPGITVHILFPQGRISKLQELQLTTLGGNVKAYAVQGSFDDCQNLVKLAFLDRELIKTHRLISANSINIARLIPQAFYYVQVAKELQKIGFLKPPVFCVPSGNFGNLTAGILAQKCGMPAGKFIAATNSNDILPQFLQRGIFEPRPSLATLSNAMDVGNPSNFPRMQHLLGVTAEEMSKYLLGHSVNDEGTLLEIRRTFETSRYLLDPHAAVGVHTVRSLISRFSEFGIPVDAPVVVLGTAHPAKFSEVYERLGMFPLPTHQNLEKLKALPANAITIKPELGELRTLVAIS